MAQAGHLPTLDLVAQHNYSKGDSNNVFPQTINKTNYIGVQLTVPIFAGGGVNSAVRQATADAEEARQGYEYARDDLRLKVQNQYDAVRAGISRVHALERALVSADQNVLSNRKGVLAGTRTTLDVLNVEQQRFNTQVDLAKVRYQILVAWATLLSYVGDLDTDQIARINRVLKGAA
jgi:outer membrane protein TolC